MLNTCPIKISKGDRWCIHDTGSRYNGNRYNTIQHTARKRKSERVSYIWPNCSNSSHHISISIIAITINSIITFATIGNLDTYCREQQIARSKIWQWQWSRNALRGEVAVLVAVTPVQLNREITLEKLVVFVMVVREIFKKGKLEKHRTHSSHLRNNTIMTSAIIVEWELSLEYRKVSNIRRTKSPNSNVSHLCLQLPLRNILKPSVKWRMKM